MSISNAQYDAIMRRYEEKREKSRRLAKEHKEEVIELVPEYKELEDRIADVAMKSAEKYFDGDMDAISEMRNEMTRLTARQKALLAQFSFPEDYLIEKHECSDCGDTGYLDSNVKCHCLKQEIMKILYKQSNIDDLLERENFDTLTYDYYDDCDVEKMKKIIDDCKSFTNDFGNKYENILLVGDVGVGKTFLTNCMAKEVLDAGYSVIYFTSIRLFDTLSKSVFNRKYEDEEEGSDVMQDIYSCDLLIIDDLGTENVSAFVASRLFDVLNERDIRRKSTIISTNLKADAIQERYTERNFSRIFGGYKTLNPTISDIRIKKRRQSRQ